jgi:hypothetical protein
VIDSSSKNVSSEKETDRGEENVNLMGVVTLVLVVLKIRPEMACHGNLQYQENACGSSETG